MSAVDSIFIHWFIKEQFWYVFIEKIVGYLQKLYMYLFVRLSQCWWLWSWINLPEVRHYNEMTRLWVSQHWQTQFPSVGSFTCLSIEHWVQCILWLNVTCNWQACWDFANEGHLKILIHQSSTGLEPRTFSTKGAQFNHWATELPFTRHVVVIKCLESSGGVGQVNIPKISHCNMHSGQGVLPYLWKSWTNSLILYIHQQRLQWPKNDLHTSVFDLLFCWFYFLSLMFGEII